MFPGFAGKSRTRVDAGKVLAQGQQGVQGEDGYQYVILREFGCGRPFRI
jgi:hypothetical protein